MGFDVWFKYDKSKDLLWPFIKGCLTFLAGSSILSIISVALGICKTKIWLILAMVFGIPPTIFMLLVILSWRQTLANQDKNNALI